jgi:ankyrin repeat protein
LASKENKVDIVQFLLKSGANVLLKNKEGKKPVELASDRIVVRLLEGN